MMNILCYGDSNTWGYDAKTKGRFPADVRWTGVLQKELRDEYRVIEEGLGGRTTVWEDPIEEYKSGKSYLIPCLKSHSPLDLIIIMLGTNDLKRRFGLTAYDIAAGAGLLVDIVQNVLLKEQGFIPKILLVSPIHVGDMIDEVAEFREMFGYESIEVSKKFAHYYKAVAEKFGCEFLDAAEVVTPSRVDAIHFDEKGHREFGIILAKQIRKMFL